MNTPECTNEALIDELVICGIYTREHDTNPRKALLDLIHWHVSVALDPAVSSEARALQSRTQWNDMTDDEIAEAVGSPLDEVYLADFRAVISAFKEKNQ